MPLSNEKVVLRAVEPGDLDFLYILENESLKSESGFTGAPLSRKNLADYIDAYRADIFADRQLRLVIEDADSGRAVGAVDISDFDPRDRRGFVGIAISAPYRRKGYARSALGLLCAYAATQLGMHQLAAQVPVDNTASRALFAACGFRTCGMLRSWVRRTGSSYADALIFQRLFP